MKQNFSMACRRPSYNFNETQTRAIIHGEKTRETSQFDILLNEPLKSVLHKRLTTLNKKKIDLLL
jgi:hypothetical protein